MAYTYLIGWSKLNKWYYGLRFAPHAQPTDLWITYFTSSKHVKRFRQANGEPDVIEIRKVFGDPDSAIEWEEKVLVRLDVIHKEKWLNRRSAKGIRTATDPKTPEQKAKLSRAMSEIHKNREPSRSMLGKHHSQTTRRKMRISAATRPPVSLETRIKISIAKRERDLKRKLTKCLCHV